MEFTYTSSNPYIQNHSPLSCSPPAMPVCVPRCPSPPPKCVTTCYTEPVCPPPKPVCIPRCPSPPPKPICIPRCPSPPPKVKCVTTCYTEPRCPSPPPKPVCFTRRTTECYEPPRCPSPPPKLECYVPRRCPSPPPTTTCYTTCEPEPRPIICPPPTEIRRCKTVSDFKNCEDLCEDPCYEKCYEAPSKETCVTECYDIPEMDEHCRLLSRRKCVTKCRLEPSNISNAETQTFTKRSMTVAVEKKYNIDYELQDRLFSEWKETMERRKMLDFAAEHCYGVRQMQTCEPTPPQMICFEPPKCPPEPCVQPKPINQKSTCPPPWRVTNKNQYGIASEFKREITCEFPVEPCAPAPVHMVCFPVPQPCKPEPVCVPAPPCPPPPVCPPLCPPPPRCPPPPKCPPPPPPCPPPPRCPPPPKCPPPPPPCPPPPRCPPPPKCPPPPRCPPPPKCPPPPPPCPPPPRCPPPPPCPPPPSCMPQPVCPPPPPPCMF